MLRQSIAVLIGFFLLASVAFAADKEVKGKISSVDVKKKMLVVITDDGKKEYTVNDDTKFTGPRGGKSDKGIEDDRLTKGAEVTLVIAGNNKTVREVRLPERKPKDK
ncbi:MAG: hypothetical protein ACJ8FY_22945 [Gemmataceae bacterium]